MLLRSLFIIMIVLFLLIQLLMGFYLLRGWFQRWPLHWWTFYKNFFRGFVLIILGSIYYLDYLGKGDLLIVLILAIVFYQSSSVKMVAGFLFYFLRKFLGFWWNKLKIYNYRYYFYSLNVVITESDLFWLEVHRDTLYPNDNRYFRIYRRWVFWMSPSLLEESNDYFNLYILGYLARSFIIWIRLAFIYLRIYGQRLVFDLVGSELGHIFFFSFYCTFFLLLRKFIYFFHKFLWLAYIFLLRQFQYLGSNYVNFHILEELNMSWAQTQIPNNFDAFDEVTYGYVKDPSRPLVKFFAFFKSFGIISEQNGISFLNMATSCLSYWKYFLSLCGAMPLLVLLNLIYKFVINLLFAYESSNLLGRFLLNKIIRGKIALFNMVRLNSRVVFLWVFLTNILYYIFLFPLTLLRNYFNSNFLLLGFHLMNNLYYSIVMLLSFLKYLPALVFYIGRFFFRVICLMRLPILLFLAVIMFSDYQLYFIYIFSLGWFVNMVVTYIDSFHLFRPEEYIELHISYRFVASSMPTYPVEFFKTLYYYQIYVWRKISDVYRVRSAWYTMTKKWTVWIFFMRFMPFYGQTSMIQKWWFNIVYYYLLRTPILFWWTYASYDSFYGAMWVMSGFMKFFIFIPYSLFKGFIYGVAGGSRILYKTGSYLSWFIFGFLALLRDYIFWPLGRAIIYLLKLIVLGVREVINFMVVVSLKISLLLARNFFKSSVYYFTLVHLSLDDPIYLNSYKWLLHIIYGDILYYVPKLWGWGFLKLSFILELIESYKIEKLAPSFASFQENLWAWAKDKWLFQGEGWRNSPLANPLFLFLSCMLSAQKYLDILSINWQFPRDVQRNVYDFINKKNINFRFLRWVFPMRRTEMYSTARWYMPIMTYFSLINYISYYGDGDQDPWGFETLETLSHWLPAYFYGFIWSAVYIYYFLLLVLAFFLGGFFSLISTQGPTDDHINREYNWYRFLNQTSQDLRWLFPDVIAAEKFIGHTEFTNVLDTKFIYYNKLLSRSLAFDLVRPSLDMLKEDGFVEVERISQEDTNFVIPEFLDFYVTHQYPHFRTGINKGDDRFIYFSAVAFSYDPWIKILWERTEDEDYNTIGPEVLFDQVNLDHYISFFENFHAIQRKTDAYLFNNSLASWPLAKDPYSFAIIRTSIKEEFMEDKWAQYFSKLSDEYEYEDDSDITYIPWSLWGWFLAIPAMLFYKAFFFVGGSHWHYNRFSSGIIHPFMLYLHAVVNHFEVMRIIVDIAGDSYPNVKREASFVGNHQMTQYRPTAFHSVLRTSFYDYNLPYDSYAGENYEWILGKIFFYRFEYLNSSSLSWLRLVNFFTFCLILVILPSIFLRRWSLRTDFLSLNNQEVLKKWFDLNINLKKIYLWFWR